MVDVTAARHIWPGGYRNAVVGLRTYSLRFAIAADQGTAWGTAPAGFWWGERLRETKAVLDFWGKGILARGD